MNKRDRELWKVSITPNTLFLIIAAIVVNSLARWIVNALNAPFWLDTLGTCLAAVIGGPIVGAAAGILQNILYGMLFQSLTVVYFICQIMVGLIVGILFYYGSLRNFSGILIAGFLLGLLMVLVCTPINLLFNGGVSDNVWGDELFDGAVAQGVPVWIASFLAELIVEIPDKILTIILTAVIYNLLPEKWLEFLRGKISFQIPKRNGEKHD